jgi:LmbE family N-acetylglucosaminyl deacetylase
MPELPSTAAVVLPDAEVSRALVVAAHPDDIDFGAAGTIATWVDAGIQVTYLICTDGQAGGFDELTDRAQIPDIRRKEQQAAAAQVGVTDVRFLGHLDGQLQVNDDLVRDIVRVIRAVRPERMVFQSPQRRFDRIGASHPDHLAAGEASIRALYPFSRNPFAFPELLADEGLPAWSVREMWITAHPQNNHAVDVTDTAERKLAALREHASQHPDPDGMQTRVRQWMRQTAEEAGMPAGRMAEGFAVYPCG